MRTITAFYISWLKRIAAKEETLYQPAYALINELCTTSSIAELIEVLTKYEQNPGFQDKIIAWKNQLEQIILNHVEAKKIVLVSLEELLVNQTEAQAPTIKQLYQLLTEILNEPRLMLHERISSLLNVICNKQLSEITRYIINLPQTPSLEEVPKGSFFAQKPSSPAQKIGLELLRNLSAAITDTPPIIWHDANGLLQTVLSIYPDLNMIEVNIHALGELVEFNNEEIMVNQNNYGGCVLF